MSQKTPKNPLKSALPVKGRELKGQLEKFQRKRLPQAREFMLKQISPADLFQLHPDTAKSIDDHAAIRFNLTEATHELTAHEADHLAMPSFEPRPSQSLDLTPDEILNRIFKPGYELANANLDDLFPQRIKVAWKLTRELGRQLGIFRPGESLIEMVPNERDWQMPMPQRHFNPDETGYLSAGLKIIQSEALELPQPFQAHGAPGLTLGPPPIPRMFIDPETREVRTNYDPHHDPSTDPLLHLHIDALETLAEFLHIDQTSYGHAGMIGLLNPRTLRLTWPGRQAIGTYEATIIKETLHKIVKKSVHAARQHLQDEYDLPATEVEGMISLAREHAREITAGNIEDDKGVMVLRLEDFLNRSRNFGDWRAEMYALKQLALVLGITRTEPEDAMKDIIDTVKKVSGARDYKTVVNEAQSRPDARPQGLPQG